MEKDEKIKWHPAFFQAIQIELKDYKHLLTFEAEHQLTAEPLRMDTLIIKKPPEAEIKKNIGQIFRQYNIVEYKSPDDYLNINDYNKIFGYAYLYAAFQGISISDITITFIETAYPRSLLKYLREERKLNISKVHSGIYYIAGETMPVQIIESKKLSENENLWLKALTNELKPEIAQQVFVESKPFDESLNAYIYAILKANPSILEEVEKMGGETFEEVLARRGYVEKSYVDKAWNEAWDEAKTELAKNLLDILDIETIAKKTGLPLSTVQKLQANSQ